MLENLNNIFTNSKQNAQNSAAGCYDLAEFLNAQNTVSVNNPIDTTRNILCLSDNLAFLKYLDKTHFEGADFIYIDPPFNSDADYKASFKLEGKSIKTIAYSDKWDDNNSFLTMLFSRLIIAKDLLKDTGLIAIHLDTHASHYVKVLCDELFGENHFVNEIIWSYKSGGSGKRSFSKKHDTILLYSKTNDYFFNPQKEVSYNRGGKPYKFKGVPEYQDKYGKWYTLVNQKDVISIDMVGRTSKERTGYATQKPEKLISLLIESCCRPNGKVLDFFAGSGVTGSVAAKSGRSYILCDRSPLAIAIAKKRLEDINSDFLLMKETSIDLGFPIKELRLEKLDLE